MRSLRDLILFLFILVPLVGCNQKTEPPLTTQKVGGMVVYKNGKPFADGGTIEFRHQAKTGVTSISGIDANGTFSLYSITAQRKVSGAEEGSYEVTITPNSNDQNVRPILLKKKYEVVSGTNDLTIQIED